MLEPADRDKLRSTHPDIDNYPAERLARLEAAWRELQAYQEAERNKPRATDYLYDQRGQRRVRFLSDGTLEEDVRVPLLGWGAPPNHTNERFMYVSLAIVGSVWLGASLERYGAVTVATWVVALVGFFVFLASVVEFQS